MAGDPLEDAGDVTVRYSVKELLVAFDSKLGLILSKLDSKADASALKALENRVDAQGTHINSIQTRIDTTEKARETQFTRREKALALMLAAGAIVSPWVGPHIFHGGHP